MSKLLKLKQAIVDEVKSTETDEQDIHIWVQKTRGKKYMTYIRGMNQNKIELTKLSRSLKKTFCTGGNVITDKENDSSDLIIALNGKFANKIKTYLTNNNYNGEITVHGE